MIDVFGKAVMAYHLGDEETPMSVRRDDGFVVTHSPGLWFSEDVWPGEGPLMEHARGRILDVGCGAGRHALPLQNAGFDVTGLDLSHLAIDVCRKRGGEKLIAGDVFEVSIGGADFDTVLLFGNNIGMAGSPERVVAMLNRLRLALAPGGQLLIASLDVSITDNPVHLAYHEANRAAGDPIGRIKIRLEYRDEVGAWFDWLHPSPDELRGLAEQAGLIVREMMPLDTGPYGAILETPLS